MILTEPPKIEAEPLYEFPGIVATKTSLTVFDSATDQQLNAAFSKIAKMEKSVAWWLGDLGIAIQERKRAQKSILADALFKRAAECTKDDDGRKACTRT